MRTLTYWLLLAAVAFLLMSPAMAGSSDDDDAATMMTPSAPENLVCTSIDTDDGVATGELPKPPADTTEMPEGCAVAMCSSALVSA